MPTVKLPITGGVYQNIDDQSLDLRNAEVRNFYVNEADYSEKRPGLTEFVDLGTARSIDGLYWWETKQWVLAASNGSVWKITDNLGTKAELTASEKLQIGERVSFADNGTTAVFANGGKIIESQGVAADALYLTDADAPTLVTHVAFHDQYMLWNNDTTGTFGISEVADYSTIRAIDVFTAESNPDIINALHVGLGEIALFGPRSVEFWVNDGVTPFSRITQATVESGCIAPYTVVLIGDTWMYLDENRKVVELRGRIPVEVSTPVDRTIQGMSQVNGAIGEVYTIDGLPLYVLNFPQDARTLVYNYQKKDWTEWDYFNQATGNLERYRGNAYAYAKAWNFHLVGDHENGKIYKAGLAYTSDDSNPIMARRRTGFVTLGTSLKKIAHEVRFRVKQSIATASVPNPKMMVRWRNDGGAWGPERWIDLGPVGDHENIVRLTQLGSFRSRQWEIRFTDDASFVLADAEVDIEVVDR